MIYLLIIKKDDTLKITNFMMRFIITQKSRNNEDIAIQKFNGFDKHSSF